VCYIDVTVSNAAILKASYRQLSATVKSECKENVSWMSTMNRQIAVVDEETGFISWEAASY
jgi:hypothetical protein